MVQEITQAETGREEWIDALAETYHRFLVSIPYDDQLYMIGIQEGRKKFLANLNIHLVAQSLPRGRKSKYYTTDFVTANALEQLREKQLEGLIYEHIVPKDAFIQAVCEDLAAKGKLTVPFIRDLFDRYLWTATVTATEDRLLKQRAMPLQWDGSNRFARYEEAGIDLQPHRKDYF